MNSTDHDATNAYQSLVETLGHDDPRWAFGTGVEDVQAEITSPVPDGVISRPEENAATIRRILAERRAAA